MSMCIFGLSFLSLLACANTAETYIRIVGGENVDIKLFPYQVSIQKNGYHFCGGSLISNNTVLSAAHCFGISISNPSSSYRVRLGSNSTSVSGKTYRICSVKIHERYSTSTLENDISIVKLCSNVSLSNEISTINISTSSNYTVGSYANVSGYGVLNENGTTIPPLQAVSVQLMSRTTCNTLYSAVSQVTITTNMICAGDEEGGKDACQGDSGGPLTQNNQLIGIVSFGIGCARKSFPGVYTNVGPYNKWIHKNIGNSGNKILCNNQITNVLYVIFMSVIFINIYLGILI